MVQVNNKTVDRMVARYGDDPASVIQVLQDVQAKYGYLPQRAVERVASRLGIPRTQVYHAATFYSAFSLTPKGRHRIHVCVGTACHVRGAAMIAEKVQRDLKVEPGGTTADGEWSLDEVACVGACAMGPVVIVDGEPHGEMTQVKFDRMLRAWRREAKSADEAKPAASKSPAKRKSKTARGKRTAAKK